MAWRLVKHSITTITPKLAEKFNSMDPPPPRDRAIKKHRTKHLQKCIDSGTFRPPTWAFVVCRATGKTYRVNGQHTSSIYHEMFSNKRNVTPVSVTIEEYECDEIDDIPSLYSTFDNHASVRTAYEINQITAGTRPALIDVIPTMINVCVTGMTYGTWKERFSAHDAEEKAGLIVDNVEFILWYADLMENKIDKRMAPLRRGGVVGAMFNTWKINPAAADKFWREVKNESGPNPEDQTRRFMRWLQETRQRIHNPNPDYEGTSIRQNYSVSILYWNHHHDGVPTIVRYQSKRPIPDPVAPVAPTIEKPMQIPAKRRTAATAGR
jgi:hypothetical protein